MTSYQETAMIVVAKQGHMESNMFTVVHCLKILVYVTADHTGRSITATSSIVTCHVHMYVHKGLLHVHVYVHKGSLHVHVYAHKGSLWVRMIL